MLCALESAIRSNFIGGAENGAVMENTKDREGKDFIRRIVSEDIATGKNDGRVHTRWPPEPNGYIHIGHAMSILLNYSVAQEFGGHFNLRFDDTNPAKEEVEFVEAIQRDVAWLGADWEDRLYFASGYFEQLCDWAIHLIREGKAYVCDLTAEQISEYRGTAIRDGNRMMTPPGVDSPYRDRMVEENLDLFNRMRAGEFADGSKTLRAKIDMSHPNLNMRDPVLYRIMHVEHHRTGDTWCIYPTYDWTHGQSDAIEGITHSLCTLEFENHRPLYDWFIENLPVPHRPRQIEFAAVGIGYTVMSKRYLRQLVEEAHVRGWDDPRMPTVAGMRRRGYTPKAIRAFVKGIGVTKVEGTIEMAFLEHHLRQDLNARAPRIMGVINPLKVVLTNYPEDHTEMVDAVNNPEDPEAGTREVPFSRELYIEREDFMEEPPKKFYRLAPGREVRLRYGYFIRCEDVVKDADGNVIELQCTYDPETRGGSAPDGRKVKATLHWVSASHAVQTEVRLYDHLFDIENPMSPEDEKTWLEHLNPDSVEVRECCWVEPSLRGAAPGTRYQLERLGYFCVDLDSTLDRPVLNRTVTLRDSWKKAQRKA